MFELERSGLGNYNYSQLLNFNGDNGIGPGGLLLDSKGNLYGTTFSGGTHMTGTAFALNTNGSGSYTYSNLFNFGGFLSAFPRAGLIADSQGNLYGTSSAAASGGDWNTSGTVYELKANGSGGYYYTQLLNFTESDNAAPGGLFLDNQGHLYGTTTEGGGTGNGSVFELNAPGGYTTLFNFNGNNGAYPYASLISDSQGNLYGTTAFGANGAVPGAGTVYELTPTSSGGYTYIDLFDFGGNNGTIPYAGLLLDTQGNLYGTTYSGGANGDGTVFELQENAPGSYTYSDLLDFNGSNGANPSAGLLSDNQGNLYGTTTSGGVTGDGTVFELERHAVNSATPEPGSIALLTGISLSGSVFLKRRRKSRLVV